MANQIKYQVGFDIQKEGLNQLKSSLQQIQKLKISDVMKINNTDAASATETLRQVKTQATNVENALKKAFNTKLNTLNIEQFNKTLKNSGSSISQVQQAFSQVGAAGQAAFNNVATQILNTNVQLRQSNKLLDSMATSMANTIKWSITSSIVNNITQSIQNAYYYAKDLDRSLTDIRIVTGDSADQMQRFANTANSAAKDLGRSTLDYTKAALAFYQQGLSDDQVQARTSVTLKAENITGIGSDMIDYLTSVWNGFNVSAEQSEEYVDKLAAVADTTASNMGQLATAISKVASTANAMGVDIDQLNGQIATVIATTRQAPESVGVAFKTIYARMNDIKTGADEAQVSLGNYSGKMAALGFNVLDANGHLRDTGEVIEEIGGRWESLTREQQINLAQTMAGQRQYNNLIALFDNWDKYLQSVNTSLNAQGTLNEKNDRYLESLEAHMIELGTEAERTYDILFDEKTVKGFVDVFGDVLKGFNNFIDGLGGGIPVLMTFGSTLANIFNKQISDAIMSAKDKFDIFINNKNIDNLKNQVADSILSQRISQGQYDSNYQQAAVEAAKKQAEIYQQIYAVRKGLTQESYNELTALQQQIGMRTQQLSLIENYQSVMDEVSGHEFTTYSEILNLIEQQTLEINNQKQLLHDVVEETRQYVETVQQGYLPYVENEQALNRIQSLTHSSLLAQEQRNKASNIYNSMINNQAITTEDIKFLSEMMTKQLEYQNTLLGKANEAKALYDRHLSGEVDALKAQNKESQKLLENGIKRGQNAINLRTVVQNVTAGLTATTSILGAISKATDETANSAEKVNAAWSGLQGSLPSIAGIIANSILPGSGMVVTMIGNGIMSVAKGLLDATGIWDKIEDHFKTTKQKVEEFNEAINQSNQNNKSKNVQIANLQQVAKEYQKLSEKAGAYGVNLDQLTQDEQDRYHEITDTFAEYNQAVIVGYDEQGHAIVRGQDALKETIEVLKQAKRQADKAALGGTENVLENVTARHDKEKSQKQNLVYNTDAQLREANANLQQYKNDHASYQGKFNDFAGFSTRAFQITFSEGLAEENEELANQLTKYSALIQQYNKVISDGVSKGEEAYLNNIFQKRIAKSGSTIIQYLKDANAFGEGLLDSDYEKIFSNMLGDTDEILKGLQAAVDEKKQALDDATKKQEEKTYYTEEDADALLRAFSIDDVNRELYDNLQEEFIKVGWNQKDLLMLLIDTITSSTDDIPVDQVYQSMVDKIKLIYDNLVQSGQIIKSAENESIKDIEEIFANNDQSVKQISDAIIQSINNIWLNNPQIQQMLNNPEQKDMIINLIKSIYGLDNLNFVFKDGVREVFKVFTAGTSLGKEIASTLNDSIEEGISGYTDTHAKNFLQNWLNQNFSEEQLNKINQQINKFKPQFKTLEEAKQWIQDFLAQDAQDDNVNNIIKNFDKVSSAIQKIQSGKDLSYKEKTNLLSNLYEGQVDPSKLQDTEQLLKDFEDAVLTTSDSMQRAEGLSILATSFEKLQQLKSKISPAEYQALWNDIFGQEVKQLNLTEDKLEQFAKANNLAFNSNQTKQAALNLYKESENLSKLEKAVDSAKDKFKDYKNAQAAVKDSQALGHLQTLNELFASLGVETDYQWIIDNINKISEALKNGTFNAEDFKKQVERVTSTSSSFDNFQTDKKEVSTLTSARDTLTKGGELSDEQMSALFTVGKEYSILNEAAQNGVNSKEYLDVLNQIIAAKQSELEVTKELLLAENEKHIQQLQNRKTELEEIKKQSQQDYAKANFKVENEGQFSQGEVMQAESDAASAKKAQIEADEELNQIQTQLIEKGKERLALQQQISETKLDADVDTDQWENLADHIQDVADETEELHNGLQTDRKGAEKLSEEILRFDDACQNVVKSYKNWTKALESGSIQDQVQAMSEMREAYADLLDLDGGSLSEDFLSNTDNLNDMKAAIDGDTQAYDRLMIAAQQDIIGHIKWDEGMYEDFMSSLDTVQNSLDLMNFQTLEIGADLNQDNFLQELGDLVNAAHMTAEQATDYLASMGIDAEVVEQKNQGTQNKTITGFDSELIPQTRVGQVPIISGRGQDMEVRTAPIQYTVYDSEYIPRTTTTTDTKENSAFSLKVTSAHKSSGGGFKFKQASNGGGSAGSARRAGSGGSGGRGGKGGKGGSKGSAAKPDKGKKDKKKKIEDERDIYHDINIQIEKINRNLDRAQKKQDHLYGKDLLDNLRQQSKLLEEQKKKLEEKLKLQEKDLASQQKALKGLGVTFDAYGNITNYMKIVGKQQDQVNKKTDKYNKLVKEYNKETNKNKKDKLKERLQKLDKQINKTSDSLQNLKDKIKNYDELREAIEDSKDDINEAEQERIEKNVQRFRTTIDVHLDMSAAQRDWNNFYRNVIEKTDVVKDSNFDKIFADAAKSSKDFFSYFGNGDTAGSIETITNQLIKTQAEIEKIDKGGTSAIYGKDKEKALENLKTDLASLQDQLEGMLSSIDEVDQAYLSTIDEIDNQFNKQMQNYGFVEQLLTHDMDLLSLLYGDQNYEAMDKYYTQLNENSNKQIDFLRQQAAWWKERWQAAVDAGDTNAAEKFEQHYRQTIGNLNSMIEQSIQTIQDKYINSINKIFDELDRRISDGKGSDFVEKEWDLLNKNADEYYDTINAAFALQDLRGQFNKAINDTKDLKNQQALKRLMDEQLTNLENKDKLTEYDVERAQKLLELEQARIALEDAQAAKTTMRLKRDSQGNYSYEYIADDDDILQTQRRLAQLNNDLYNFDKERYNSNLSDALQAWKDFQSQYKAIMSDMSKSQEDQARQAALLQQQYAEYINGKLAQNEVIRGNLTDSALQDYALLNNEDAKHYKNLSIEEKDLIMKDLVPTWDSGIQAMMDAMTKEGGFVPTCQQAFEKVSEASKEYKNDVKETAESAGTDFEKTKEGVSALAEQTSKLITANDALMTNMDKEMTKVASLRDYIHSLAEAYKEVTKNAMITSGTIHDLLQQTNLKSANDTNDFNKIDDKSIGLGTWDAAKDQVLNGLDQADSTVYGSQLSEMMQIFEDSTMDSLSSDERINRLNERVSTMAIILDELKTSLEGSLYSRANNIKGGFSNLFDNTNGESIEQTVNIEAVFPNVNTRKEIEDAFYELANMAIQRALRN